MPLRTPLPRKPTSGRWQRRPWNRKEVLSVNMISLPLGDFRHLSHIGASGHTDSFGDLSFLKEGHSLLLQSSKSEQNLFLPPPPKPPRVNLDEAGRCSPVWEHAPVDQRQKCSSLPLLDTEEDEDEDTEPNGNGWSPARGSLSSGRDSTQTNPEETQPNQTDSAFAFSLDLGPSILDSVLQVMDKVHQS
ncbi:cdc42 effector protein 3-like [Puntigrus tetrazona]|uniref:cdc42 effector protein 3-like n=1 Tax=Puntigrus tetrazona TaxID=1606681 RepID=UPI001C89A663|nr:cdc42 effector protein 3-like [Puntigrus tetrazona]XP_043088373.1 cdc42 effector protein 3-like [Puntigrus tetrazona]XP_043088374.1 cdc42 effector protein 3-like [Puntigrus tetrazona]XP_043088375.1 cdc42 effector protein 3-like [Puntigrus tetrazona]XP_043088376.1 cdc42 effector protein 3-like [Puntigrus tetrazona]XP_043088377.1 cdc42 effector protein 3-like [Puntigrus tetrazona]